MKEEIVVTDEEGLKFGLLPFKDHIASMAGYIDRKAGYETTLVSYSYDPNLFEYTFIVNPPLTSLN